jgi:glucose/arabinose dehydrogenase
MKAKHSKAKPVRKARRSGKTSVWKSSAGKPSMAWIDLEYFTLRRIVRIGFIAALIVVATLEVISPIGRFAWADSDFARDDTGPNPLLDEPVKQVIPKIKIAEAIGWSGDAKPMSAPGFDVRPFATELDHPRWLYVLPNGDVLVAETNAPERKDDRKGLRGWFMKISMKKAGAGTPSANRITLLRDADGDGKAETKTVFLKNLVSPFGMALVGDDLYVANTDGIVKFPYTQDATVIERAGEPIAALPAGTINHHWTKNIIASRDGKKLYATVGSNSNVGERGLENEKDRAAILEIDLTTRSTRVFVSGLRNPNGLDWQPSSKELWTAVNERDEIGDRLVPDYIAAVHDGEFFGWPFSYYGAHMDARAPKADGSLAPAEMPDYALGSHTASLGLAFYADDANAPDRFPERFRGGAFVGQHGSWNRSAFSGYKVIFVPFDSAGRPSGPMEDILTGFLDSEGRAQGRPVGVAVDKQGALLVADDVGNRIWRVTPARSSL